MLVFLSFSFHADALIGYVQQCTTTATFDVVYVFDVFVCGLVVPKPGRMGGGGGGGIKRNKKAKTQRSFLVTSLPTTVNISNPTHSTTYSYPPP